jgi:uncharacterized protein with PIN domain
MLRQRSICLQAQLAKLEWMSEVARFDAHRALNRAWHAEREAERLDDLIKSVPVREVAISREETQRETT